MFVEVLIFLQVFFYEQFAIGHFLAGPYCASQGDDALAFPFGVLKADGRAQMGFAACSPVAIHCIIRVANAQALFWFVVLRKDGIRQESTGCERK